MKIAIGSDHGGLDLKESIIEFLKDFGNEVKDFGTYTKDSCDYTDFGYKVAKSVADNSYDRGIVICTTGIGMSIIANKVRGVRCALVCDTTTAKLTREHNNSNVLALGQNLVSVELAKQITKIWLETEFSNNERHTRRVEKISLYEGEENGKR